MLLSNIGTNSTVVAAGILHDTLDDSFLSYEYVFRTFGAGVADLVEGVRERAVLRMFMILFCLCVEFIYGSFIC